jgi:hypothetical protein
MSNGCVAGEVAKEGEAGGRDVSCRSVSQSGADGRQAVVQFVSRKPVRPFLPFSASGLRLPARDRHATHAPRPGSNDAVPLLASSISKETWDQSISGDFCTALHCTPHPTWQIQ